MEKISIIVPIYNVAPYLPACLDSIIHQTYLNLEIILVDDGSTDSSNKICEQYKTVDPRIQVIHQKNQGVSTARNAGLALAAGHYITFADADDLLEPSLLAECIKAIETGRMYCIMDLKRMSGKAEKFPLLSRGFRPLKEFFLKIR